MESIPTRLKPLWLVFSFIVATGAFAQVPANSPDIRFGIVFGKTNNELTVTSVVGQVPYQAGLRPGDVVTAIDGHPTAPMQAQEAVAMMKGPAGSKVGLDVIKRHTTSPVHVELTRSVLVVLPSVMNRITKSKAGLLTVRSLDKDTAAQAAQALEQFRAMKVRGIILDLRDNGGGYEKTITELGQLFLSPKKLLYVTHSNNRDEEHRTESTPVFGGPLVVLVNSYTASGAEVLASALQINGRAKVIGETTGGKATVRAGTPGGPMTVVAIFYDAKHHDLNGRGVKPDMEIDQTLPEEKIIEKAGEAL